MRRHMPVRRSARKAVGALVTAGTLTAALLGAVTGTASPAAAAAARPSVPAKPANPSVAATTSLPGYTAVTPVRICDTRAAGPGVTANQCDTNGHSPLSTSGVINVTVAGVDGVPAGATSVVLHVTATATQASSYLTVWPTGQAQPPTASVNWAAGQTVANLVASGVGTGGQVSVYNYAFSVDVVIDLEGYVAPSTGGLFVPVTPVRVCDTRASQPANQCNANGTASGTLGAGTTKVVNVGSTFGVPAGATGVVLNVTATTTSTASYFDVYADGAAVPFASSLNWAAGQTISNRVFTAVSSAGNVDVFNAYGTADVVIDLTGYFSPTVEGGGFFPVTPTRICDTRPAGPGVASNTCDTNGLGTLAPGEDVDLFGFNPVVSALVMNVTVTNTTAPGFLTVFPDDDTTIPLAADITFAAGQTIGNLVVADLGTSSAFDFFNGANGNTDVIIDVVGYFSPTAPTASARPSVTLSPQSLVMPKSAKRLNKPLSHR